MIAANQPEIVKARPLMNLLEESTMSEPLQEEPPQVAVSQQAVEKFNAR
jgi:hypothetical protein